MINVNAIIRAAKQSNDLIVTPVIRDWLLKHGDEALSEEVAEKIKQLLMQQPRNRAASFSGSASGYCLRRQELGFAGTPEDSTDPQLQNIFNDGKWRHLRWQAMGLTTGVFTDVEYLLQWKQMLHRGSMDARGEVSAQHPKAAWRGLEFGFELKGVSTFQFGRLKADGMLEAFPKHRKQVAKYCYLGNLDLFSTVYEDKTTQEFHEWVTIPTADELTEAEIEIQELESSVRNRTLHPVLAECSRRKGPYLECPYGRNNRCHAAISAPPAPFVR